MYNYCGRVKLVMLAPLVILVLKDQKDQEVMLEHKVFLDLMVKRERKEKMEKMDILENK